MPPCLTRFWTIFNSYPWKSRIRIGTLEEVLCQVDGSSGWRPDHSLQQGIIPCLFRNFTREEDLTHSEPRPWCIEQYAISRHYGAILCSRVTSILQYPIIHHPTNYDSNFTIDRFSALEINPHIPKHEPFSLNLVAEIPDHRIRLRR